MFKPPEALPIHTLSKLHYLIHKPYLTNHLSFPELLNCGTHCHPLLSPNPTICHLLNLTSTNLILSPYLFPSFSQFFLCQGFVIGPMAFPWHYLLKKEKKLAYKKVKVVPYTFIHRGVPIREETYYEPLAYEIGWPVPFLTIFISIVLPPGTYSLLGEQ